MKRGITPERNICRRRKNIRISYFSIRNSSIKFNTLVCKVQKLRTSQKQYISPLFSSPEPKAHKVSLLYTNGPSSVRRPHFQTLWSQLANLDQILWVALLGLGKGCITFWDRLNQTSGFHDNRKTPLTYNGETMSPPFLGCFWSEPFYTCK